jgi:signal transduction histidine kinase
LNISLKITIAFAIPIIIIAILTAISFKVQQEVVEAYEYYQVMYAPATRALISIIDDFTLLQDIVQYNPQLYTRVQYEEAIIRLFDHFGNYRSVINAKASDGSYILPSEKRTQYQDYLANMEETTLIFDVHAREILDIRADPELDLAEKEDLVAEKMKSADLAVWEFWYNLDIAKDTMELDDLDYRQELSKARIDSAELLSFILVLAAMGSAAIAFTTVRSVIKRIGELRRATQSIGRQDYYSIPITISGSDELSQLALDFEEMRKKIGDYESNLNDLVRERTMKLEVAYDELKRADKMKDEFVNIAAHELRTPLTPLLLNAEELVEKYPDDESVLKILRSAQRLRVLTNDILDVSRMDSGNLKMQPETTNIAGMVQRITKEYVTRSQSPKLQILFKNNIISKEKENVAIDRTRIAQVLSNLINNAVKFTDSGKVEVVLQESEDSVRISISDEGKGIDEDIMDKLFEKKFISKSERGGTGLGLYISRKLVEAHGGKIWAKNNHNRRGATFTFTIPYNSILLYRPQVN